jgi:hypothetical protein
MGEVSMIGLDIAKSVFQVHGADVDGAVVIRKRVSRAAISMASANGTSRHFAAKRKLVAEAHSEH